MILMPVLIPSFLISVSFKNHIHLLPFSPLWLHVGILYLLKIVMIVPLPDPDISVMEPLSSFIAALDIVLFELKMVPGLVDKDLGNGKWSWEGKKALLSESRGS